MDKYHGKYYLQYACPGAEYNVYADGVYVSDSPLGPFVLAENNPYSYHPGGYMPGAGHGSTMWDRNGNLWHASTMRISVNHQFERRVGIWRAGFDEDGELFCNQRYGDWPVAVEEENTDAWVNPQWYLLSYKKSVRASSYEKEKNRNLQLTRMQRHGGSHRRKMAGYNWILEKCMMSGQFRLILQMIKLIFRYREKLRVQKPSHVILKKRIM